ncbi:hypothetical protein SARC_03422 [Sphaeroforma arctica JP610]|uniref:Uncharacterized protein n=1 Tax=Sphaeroforma arctica JP610 TaxID=667725 RepID=A0A0L0G5N1_9EUKA|nr:hypothetical protein SARC_03422 [Sphaeroforma arctica JP610]KNC84342.1 hypothetical protein SARC_03422 [Sphaeroforma arctica JP610]|eukprot:XP_014158244.1 hypothetical protein SARC_03422 [Sphaeroforma arctica JP610]
MPGGPDTLTNISIDNYQDVNAPNSYLVYWWYYQGAAEARVVMEEYLSSYPDGTVGIGNIQYDSIKHATFNPDHKVECDQSAKVTTFHHGKDTKSKGWIAGSIYMNQSTPQVADYIINFFASDKYKNTGYQTYKGGWGFTPLGGQVKNISKIDTAFWAREAQVELEVYMNRGRTG